MTWLTTQQLADHLQLHPQVVERMARLGKIPCGKIGRQYRFCQEEVDEQMKAEGKQGRSGKW